MFLTSTTITALGACGLLGLFWWASRRWPPTWSGDLAGRWSAINRVALTGGLFMALAFAAAAHSQSSSSVVVAVALLTYCALQSAFTDEALRLVDGRLQYGALVALTITNLITLPSGGMEGLLLKASVVFTLGFLAARFLVPETFMGASDYRALALLSSAVIPHGGLQAFTMSLGVTFLLALAYALWRTFTSPREGEKRAWWRLTAKVSLPLVPMILGPGVALLVATAVVPGLLG